MADNSGPTQSVCGSPDQHSNTTTSSTRTANQESSVPAATTGHALLTTTPTERRRDQGDAVVCPTTGRLGPRLAARRYLSTLWLLDHGITSMPRGARASLFRTWVFPCWTRMDEGWINAFCRIPWIALTQSGWDCRACRVGVLSGGDQSRHEWVALFTTFCLSDCVDDTILVLPRANCSQRDPCPTQMPSRPGGGLAAALGLATGPECAASLAPMVLPPKPGELQTHHPS